MSTASPGNRLRLVVAVIVVGLVACARSASADVERERDACWVPVLSLFKCLDFLEGKAGGVPSRNCCIATGELLRNSPKCICGVLKDGAPVYLHVNFTYNTTIAYYFPSLCHIRFNLSKCIDLLGLPPNSADARKFNQAANDNARLLASAPPGTSANLPTISPAFPPTMGLIGRLPLKVHRACDGYWRCQKSKIMRLIEGLIPALALASIFVCFLMYKKHRSIMEASITVRKEREEIISSNSGGRSVKLFSGKDIKKATNSFSNDLLLGSGGFGDVYRGCFEDDTPIAVKIGKIGWTDGRDSVLNEASILAQVNHRSLVCLLGCCVDLDQPILVYEFIPNGTLHDHIHTSKYGFLNWHQRLKIAHQAAQGLAYLHFSAMPPIYHRDVKSGNILLDEKCNAKVSDFNISRLVHPDRTHVSTCVMGTMGYLDPEYYRTYQLTAKSDVYSFGVVLLELLTSQRVIDSKRDNGDVFLVQYVRHGLEGGTVLDVVDEDLRLGASQWSLEAMKALCSVAMRCVEEKRHDRPSMKDVVQDIELVTRMDQTYAFSGSKKA